jgi:hypothetical protein
LKVWADQGIGKLYQLADENWGLEISVSRAEQLPTELKKRWEEILFDELKWLVGTLAPVYYFRLDGYVFAHEC